MNALSPRRFLPPDKFHNLFDRALSFIRGRASLNDDAWLAVQLEPINVKNASYPYQVDSNDDAFPDAAEGVAQSLSPK